MRPCVLIPTYDNPRTLEAVVRGALAQCPDVLVVDDGSGVATQEVLGRLSGEGHGGLVVLTHPQNQGKGAALRTGLDEAHRRGFSHAVSMDSDGQHLASDLPALLAEARAHPDALILGERDLERAGAGKGSRFGRKNSNFWTWVLTGQRLPDTQTGFRVYPVAPLAALHFTSSGYDFEIEVLVKAAWSGMPLRSHPIQVRYFQGDERVSHLHPVWDFLRIGRLNARYVALRLCLPEPYLRLRATRRFRERPFLGRWAESLRELFLREPGPPRRLAASVALGLFWAVAPVWGFQIALVLLSAHVLGLSKPVALVASHLSVPVMIPPILYASLVLGRFTLGIPEGVPWAGSLEVAPGDLPAYLVGSVLLGVLLAAVGGVLAFALASGLRGRFGGRAEAAGASGARPGLGPGGLLGLALLIGALAAAARVEVTGSLGRLPAADGLEARARAAFAPPLEVRVTPPAGAEPSDWRRDLARDLARDRARGGASTRVARRTQQQVHEPLLLRPRTPPEDTGATRRLLARVRDAAHAHQGQGLVVAGPHVQVLEREEDLGWVLLCALAAAGAFAALGGLFTGGVSWVPAWGAVAAAGGGAFAVALVGWLRGPPALSLPFVGAGVALGGALVLDAAVALRAGRAAPRERLRALLGAVVPGLGLVAAGLVLGGGAGTSALVAGLCAAAGTALAALLAPSRPRAAEAALDLAQALGRARRSLALRGLLALALGLAPLAVWGAWGAPAGADPPAFARGRWSLAPADLAAAPEPEPLTLVARGASAAEARARARAALRAAGLAEPPVDAWRAWRAATSALALGGARPAAPRLLAEGAAPPDGHEGALAAVHLAVTSGDPARGGGRVALAPQVSAAEAARLEAVAAVGPELMLLGPRPEAGRLADAVAASRGWAGAAALLAAVAGAALWFGRLEPTGVALLPLGLGGLWALGLLGLAGVPRTPLGDLGLALGASLGLAHALRSTQARLDRWRADLETPAGAPHPADAAALQGALVALVALGALAVLGSPGARTFALHGALSLAGVELAAQVLIPAVLGGLLLLRGPAGTAGVRHLVAGAHTAWVLASGGVWFLLVRQRFVAPEARPRAALDTITRLSRQVCDRLPIGTRTYVDAPGAPLAERLAREPGVLVANHASMYDIVAVLSLGAPCRILIKDWVARAPIMGPMVRLAGYLNVDRCGPEALLAAARASLAEGVSILVFPEGTRSRTTQVGRFKNGAFALARELGARVTPIALVGTEQVVRAGTWFVGDHHARLLVLEPLAADPSAGELADRRAARACRDRIREVRRREWPGVQRGRGWWRPLAQCYHYLGPVVSHYAAAKLRTDPLIEPLPEVLASALIAPTDGAARGKQDGASDGADDGVGALAPAGELLVAGSGYGLMAARLALGFPERAVRGVDIDPRKVEVARAALGTDRNLRYEVADLFEVDLGAPAAALLVDVLHYWPMAEQARLVERVAAALAPGGVLLFRDGVREEGGHGAVRRGEALARAIGFTRAGTGLHFGTAAEYRSLLASCGLTLQSPPASAAELGQRSHLVLVARKPGL